jgi:transketolase
MTGYFIIANLKMRFCYIVNIDWSVFFTMDEIKKLKLKAIEMRKDIMEMTFKGQATCHLGSSMSCIEIVAALYFKFMNIKTEDPNWEDRDRFILSKGHAVPAQYAALAEAGFFEKKLLYTLQGYRSEIQGLPIFPTSGSLGNGLSVGVGIAHGLKIKGKKNKVFVIIGDGEMQEGLIWEAALYAPNAHLGNLVVIVDNNHYQSNDNTDKILPVGPITDKWRAFGWQTFEMNGHDMNEIVNKLEIACVDKEFPTLIVAHTTKGKGISFMENNNVWHAKIPNEEEYHLALQELEQAVKLLS